MRISRLVGLVMAAGLLAMTGCDNKIKEQNTALTQENETLRAQLKDRDAALDSTNQELRARTLELAEHRQRGAISDSGSGVKIDTAGTQWTIAGDLLFDPGQTSIKSGAKKQLDDIAKALNGKYASSAVRVVGHTDSDPIKKQKARFKDNYELGLARASSVRDYLASKGVSSSRLSVASKGADEPKGDKKSSRRVEIFAEGR